MAFTNEQVWAVGKIPSGLFIITSYSHGKPVAMLGSWVQQVSFEPLLVSAAVGKSRQLYEGIQETGRFCINVVGKDNDKILSHFWSGDTNMEEVFRTLSHIQSDSGPILRDCMGSIECKLHSESEPGDHVLVIGEVTHCVTTKSEDSPLTHVRKSGLDY